MRGAGLTLAPTAMASVDNQWRADQTISDLPARASAFHGWLHQMDRQVLRAIDTVRVESALRLSATRCNVRRHAGFAQPQPRGDAKSFEEVLEVLAALREMRPTVAMDWNSSALRASPTSFFSVACGSLYSPGASKVGSVSKRKPFASMSAVGPTMRVMTGALMAQASLAQASLAQASLA
jgi:hypothetical protein